MVNASLPRDARLLPPVLWNRQNQLGYAGPTNFAAPHNLGFFASLTTLWNPKLTFYNGFKILRSAFSRHFPKMYIVYLWGVPYPQVLYLSVTPYLQVLYLWGASYSQVLYDQRLSFSKNLHFVSADQGGTQKCKRTCLRAVWSLHSFWIQ